MIVDLPDTTTSKVSKKIMSLCERGGVIALGRDQVDSSPVTAVAVEGASDSSTILLAAWLTLSLEAPVTLVADPAGTGIHRVRLSRSSGDVQLFRPGLSVTELTQPGQPAQRISLPRRSLRDFLAEELRHLDPDEVFGQEVRTLERARKNTDALGTEPAHHGLADVLLGRLVHA